MQKIIGVGEIVWDMLPSGAQLGGAPVNFAYYAQALGADAYPVTATGDDPLGQEARKILETNGINLNYVQTSPLPTGQVMVTVDKDGVPQYDIVENVAWDDIGYPSSLLELAPQADAICWGTLAQRGPKSRLSILSLVDSAKEGCLKIFDINLRQSYYSPEIIKTSLERADILKLNEDEWPVVRGMLSLPEEEAEGMACLSRMYSLQNIIYTKGAVCSKVYGPEGLLSELPTPKVEVTDTVGAGDSFTAAFVMSRLLGKDVPLSHRKAVEVSAYVCTCNGAINPLPESLKL